MEVADIWEGTYSPFLLQFYCLNQEKISRARPHCLCKPPNTLVYCRSCPEPWEVVLVQVLFWILQGPLPCPSQLSPRTECLGKPCISLVSYYFLTRRDTARTLNYFWKQSNLCPFADLGSWLLPAMLAMCVILSPQCHCHFIPLLILPTLPSGLASLLPACRGAWLGHPP